MWQINHANVSYGQLGERHEQDSESVSMNVLMSDDQYL